MWNFSATSCYGNVVITLGISSKCVVRKMADCDVILFSQPKYNVSTTVQEHFVSATIHGTDSLAM